jgi:hypothetical protein
LCYGGKFLVNQTGSCKSLIYKEFLIACFSGNGSETLSGWAFAGFPRALIHRVIHRNCEWLRKLK